VTSNFGATPCFLSSNLRRGANPCRLQHGHIFKLDVERRYSVEQFIFITPLDTLRQTELVPKLVRARRGGGPERLVLGLVVAPVLERILGDHRAREAQAGGAPESARFCPS
jgi:hypothetical protein